MWVDSSSKALNNCIKRGTVRQLNHAITHAYIHSHLHSYLNDRGIRMRAQREGLLRQHGESIINLVLDPLPLPPLKVAADEVDGHMIRQWSDCG